MRTSEYTEAVIRGLSRELFGGQLQFELVVLPPEEGTFLARLRVVLVVGGVIWAFLETDIGKGFIKGLTDHEPAYWSETLGKTLKTSAEEALEDRTVHPSDVQQFEALIVSEMAKSFLRKDNGELARAGISPRQFRDAFEAKNAFYQACIETPQVKAIGFSDEPVFPIKRSDFARLQAVLPPKEDEVEHPWSVGTALLKVTSPNWDRDDRSRRWKGRDQQGRDRYFTIEDEAFWGRVSTDTISTHVIDVMKVQWAFQGKVEQPRNCRVIRVLEFNGFPLSDAFTDDELFVEVGKLAELSTEQRDLFDDR
ncbi:MAG: hypothetical protein V4597_08160 [Pseudomonadota bacterium]